MEYSIQKLSSEIKVYESTLVRLCGAFGIEIYDFTIGSRMGENAIIQPELVSFIKVNSDFFKKYHDDYYRPKSPQKISEILNRDLKEVKEYLIDEYPECFEKNEFISEKETVLKYVSSYEIDFELGTTSDLNMNRLGMIVWHLGYKQKTIVDRMKLKYLSITF